MGLKNLTINLLESNLFGCICAFVSLISAIYVGFYLSGVAYYICYALSMIVVIVSCIALSNISHMRIIKKYKRESGLSVFYWIVFVILILVSVIAHEKSVMSVLLELMAGEYLRRVAVIRLSSFCCALTGVYGLMKRSIYFDARMITASCFFVFTILVFGNGING